MANERFAQACIEAGYCCPRVFMIAMYQRFRDNGQGFGPKRIAAKLNVCVRTASYWVAKHEAGTLVCTNAGNCFRERQLFKKIGYKGGGGKRRPDCEYPHKTKKAVLATGDAEGRPWIDKPG